VVLDQLLQAKSGSAFKKHLNDFSKASGDIDMLYSRILLNIQLDDQK